MLFHQDALLDGVVRAVGDVLEASRDLVPILVVGAPRRLDGRLFNGALAIYRGQILGITLKTYLPNYREFYEKRQFTSGRDSVTRDVHLLGQRVPFGNALVYDVTNLPGLTISVEICEDVWAPIPPSTYAAFAGATVLLNLSASNITIGKAEYRRSLCASQSGRCVAAYLYAAAGPGESTTDLACDGHAMVFENHDLVAESHRFASEEQVIVADVDLDRLVQERMRMTSFNDCGGAHHDAASLVRRIALEFTIPGGSIPLRRHVERFPYVPADPAVRNERCFEAYNIQVHGLAKRLSAANIDKVVRDVDSTSDSLGDCHKRVRRGNERDSAVDCPIRRSRRSCYRAAATEGRNRRSIPRS
jgi:NAD+ synthase (glutamine-hydrolysing)